MRAYDICPIISDECDEWLGNIGFFNKPASLHFHGMRNGDLLLHSIEVGRQLQNLTDKLNLKWERAESPMLIGLLHDVCKCDDYKWDGRKRKWSYNRKKMEGHGEKSIYMLKDHIALTDEEIVCIRYHMGAFVDKSEWAGYTQAIHKYSNVLYAHTADMIASQILGI